MLISGHFLTRLGIPELYGGLRIVSDLQRDSILILILIATSRSFRVGIPKRREWYGEVFFLAVTNQDQDQDQDQDRDWRVRRVV